MLAKVLIGTVLASGVWGTAALAAATQAAPPSPAEAQKGGPAMRPNEQVPSAQSVVLPDDIRAALEHSAEQLSPIMVSWTQHFQTPLPPDEALAKLDLLYRDDHTFFAEQVPKRIIWQDGKIYSWEKSLGRDGRGTVYLSSESCFDGNVYYVGCPDGVLPDGTPAPQLIKELVSRMAEKEPEAKRFALEYFDAIGLRLPVSTEDLNARRGGRSEILWLLDGGGRLAAVEDVELNGRKATRLTLLAPNPERRKADRIDLAKSEEFMRETKQAEEFIQRELAAIIRMRALPATKVFIFYLDPEMQYAVRRLEERYEDGTLLLHVNNEQFQKLEARDLWLPRLCNFDYYTWPSMAGTVLKERIVSRVIEVAGVALNRVPDSQFVLNYTTPGSVITDRSVPGNPAGVTFEILHPLHEAASAGNKAEVERLLAEGTDVNARWRAWRTPLHYAARSGRLEVVQLLLNKGADVNAEDEERLTPLHLAAYGGHRQVAAALLKAGAEVNAVDGEGWTPAGRAAQAGHTVLAKFLGEHGGAE